MKQRRLCISVVTRNRPKMLCDLFFSLAQMTRPEGLQTSFVVVENNLHRSLEEEITQFHALMPEDEIDYLLEPQIGISAARNCALNYAVDSGFDYLVFVDDDEIVDPMWLVNLLKVRDELELDIVGSPVRPASHDPAMTFWHRIILSGIQRGEMKSEHKQRRKCLEGKSSQIKVATGSWM